MAMKRCNPKTPAQWQEAVDAAHCFRVIHDCMLYGLITGPKVNVARCDWILDEGKRRGACPEPGVLDEFVRGLAANGGRL